MLALNPKQIHLLF